MYEAFFGLKERPFTLTPNPRYVYYSAQYQEAEQRLAYGVMHREGFMVLTGVPGSGKTTLCRDLLDKLDSRTTITALLFNPFLSGVEMMQALLSELGISYPPTANRKELLDKLNNFLIAQLVLGKRCVAIFDEAQHLSAEFLEQIRVLSNLETESEKLLQIILVGQPELLERMRSKQLSQLDQRVSVRCRLGPLNPAETDRYIHHRLNVAGGRGRVQFTPQALKKLYLASGGIPRLVNLVADRALLAGFADQTQQIGAAQVRKAVALLQGEDEEIAARRSSRSRIARVAVAAILLLVVLGVLGAVAAPSLRWP
jgi:general secretion pathway protein A